MFFFLQTTTCISYRILNNSNVAACAQVLRLNIMFVEWRNDTYCQAQPQLNSTQLQLKLRLRLALIPLSPATHPATRPPTQPPGHPPSHPATRKSSLSQIFHASTQLQLKLRLRLALNPLSPATHTTTQKSRLGEIFYWFHGISCLNKDLLLKIFHAQPQLNFNSNYWAWHYSAQACYVIFLLTKIFDISDFKKFLFLCQLSILTCN